MTVAELVYMCLDEVKANSDDSYVTEEHILFLAKKYRAQLLYQYYKDIKKEIPQSNYQTICLNLEQTDVFGDGTPCTNGNYLRSTEEIPSTMTIGNNSVYPTDYYQGNITYISKERMRYVGHNKYLKNIIYCSLGDDNHLYFKSNNPQHMYLECVKMSGVFEDFDEAAKLSCDGDDSNCDYLQQKFPLEEQLVPVLIQSVVKEILGVAYRGKDVLNDATDNLSDIASYLRHNLKSNLSKQIEND